MHRTTGFVCLFALLTLGCTGGQNTLSGTVTYDGKPVESGNISFTPTDGSSAPFGAKITDGKYRVIDAKPGGSTVIIAGGDRVQGPTSSAEARQLPSSGSAAPAGSQVPDNAVGNRVTVEIKAGSQTLDFDLTAP